MTEEEKLADQRAFAVWSKSEDVAVHFNDLIMRWRLQAVGGLATLVTIAGFIVKDGDTLRVRYRGIVILGAMLTSAWSGLATIDLFYYRRLLDGAVVTLTKLEKHVLKDVSLSTDIENQAKWGGEWAPWVFYLSGLLPLLSFIAWALCNLYLLPENVLDEPLFKPSRAEWAGS